MPGRSNASMRDKNNCGGWRANANLHSAGKPGDVGTLYRGIVEMVKTSALQAEDSGFDPPCRDQPGKVAHFVQTYSCHGTIGNTYQRSSHIGQSWTICSRDKPQPDEQML